MSLIMEWMEFFIKKKKVKHSKFYFKGYRPAAFDAALTEIPNQCTKS